MATITSNYAHETPTSMDKTEKVAIVLRWTYGLVPIIAGADKFFHFLTDWSKYLAPRVADMLPFSVTTFMSIVGAIEIMAGILVLTMPRIGSFIVGLWLIGIAINVIMTGQYYDVAVRDVVMSV